MTSNAEPAIDRASTETSSPRTEMDPSAIAEDEGTETNSEVNPVDLATISRRPSTTCPAPVERFNQGWCHVVLNFTPSWFSVIMGTGITSSLLHNLPYNADWLRWISVAIFCLNIALFFVFLTISVLRYTLFKGLWKAMVLHPVQSLFLGMCLTRPTTSSFSYYLMIPESRRFFNRKYGSKY